MRSLPQRQAPVPGGTAPVNPVAGQIPTGASPSAANYKATPGARTSPMGSALYLPPIHAMADRTMPPEYWNSGTPGTG
jgi:hypothetical protein